jgi:hypothetical protein
VSTDNPPRDPDWPQKRHPKGVGDAPLDKLIPPSAAPAAIPAPRGTRDEPVDINAPALHERAIDIIRDIIAMGGIYMGGRYAADGTICRGWHCTWCQAFAARNTVSERNARAMRDDEHHSECLWRRARTLVGAADPHAKQDAQ